MLLPFASYQPDVADYNGQTIKTATNVIPRLDGYGPFKDQTVYSGALSAACRGYFYARKSDGSIKIFAGTSTKLYLLNNTDFTWTDVSQGAGTYAALTTSGQWQFAQFGNYVIAVQVNCAPQYYDLSSSTAFADLASLGDTPPQAAYISVVGRFVVLTGLLTFPYRVQWSGLGNVTQWTSGTNSSDYQDLPDGGICRGVAGGEFGALFQEATIRRMTYVPGSPLIFQIDRISQDLGLLAPYSLISNGNLIFFYSGQGFQKIEVGSAPVAIGKERVDRTFLADYDAASMQLVIGSTEPESTRVYWAYKSTNGLTGVFDKILNYDFALDRWGGTISSTGEYLASLSRPGLTLEGLDSISGSIDALTFSLDDVSNAAVSKISAVNSSHKLCFYTGSNLEASIDTAEQTMDGQRRVRVKGLRPITDAAGCYGSVSSRETLQDTANYSTEQVVNARGLCPANISTRLMRGHIRIPAATIWTYARGIEPDFTQEGKR
jgi:hypothetical protein